MLLRSRFLRQTVTVLWIIGFPTDELTKITETSYNNYSNPRLLCNRSNKQRRVLEKLTEAQLVKKIRMFTAVFLRSSQYRS